MKQLNSYSTKIGDKDIKVSFTDIAINTNKSVFVESNETIVLVTLAVGKEDKAKDYFPLSVEYEEKFYSIGKIGGNRYTRREARPSDIAVLNGRIIDRTIRPLFPKAYRNSIQIVVTILSLGETDPTSLGLLGASLCLSVSDVPFKHPISGIKAKIVDNKLSFFDISKGELPDEMTICGDGEKINMIEIGANQSKEDTLLKHIDTINTEIKNLQDFQLKIQTEIGESKSKIIERRLPQAVEDLFEKEFKNKLEDMIFAKADVEEEFMNRLGEDIVETSLIKDYLKEKIDEAVHKIVVVDDRRVDGRGMEQIRDLYAQAGGLSGRLHGTGIFYRGETHILGALTLDALNKVATENSIEKFEEESNFIFHYNFPPLAAGETGRMSGPNRRMIGHGALAGKALGYVLPSKEEFPYTMRLVSECLSSNGSTSMGSVCAGCLALMDGGVPIKGIAAGIAMGIMVYKNDYKILTDIQGYEDHHGDMDLKIAGTKTGVTAVQMDVKIEGLTVGVLREAFEKARQARLEIIGVIEKEIKEPRADLNKNVPMFDVIKISVDNIGRVIGKKGETIKQLKEIEGVEEISVEDTGEVFIYGDREGIQECKSEIKTLLKEIEVGEEYKVKIVSIKDFGAFASIDKENQGLIHISEFTPQRLNSLDGIVSMGDEIPVVVKRIDENGKIALSVKDLNPSYFKNAKR